MSREFEFRKKRFFKKHQTINANKKRAKGLIMYGCKKGYIKKLKCIKCGNINTCGHHEDYSKPLEVIWLCRSCHAKHHFPNGPSRKKLNNNNKELIYVKPKIYWELNEDWYKNNDNDKWEEI